MNLKERILKYISYIPDYQDKNYVVLTISKTNILPEIFFDDL